MRVGLAGFYGFNAYSDDLIALAIKEAFNKRADIDWRILPLGGGRYEDLDLVILGGGSLLGLPLKNLVIGLQKTDAPFAIFGTGFRNDERCDVLRYLWQRASLIGVRGQISVDGLRASGLGVEKIGFLGDPIFLLRDRGLPTDDYIRGVIRPQRNIRKGWMEECMGWIAVERKQRGQLLGFSVSQRDWWGAMRLNDTYDAICRASFWFGNRLHPFCVALINGIPAIAVESDFRKVEDVCATIDYPHWINPNDDVRGVYSHLMVDLEETMERVNTSIAVVRHRLEDAVDKVLELY